MKKTYPLNSMEIKCKQINKIKFIVNTILANACYHSKEMESQLAVAEKRGNLSEDEREIITHAWNYRSVIAQDLIQELKTYMEREHEKIKTPKKEKQKKGF